MLLRCTMPQLTTEVGLLTAHICWTFVESSAFQVPMLMKRTTSQRTALIYLYVGMCFT